MPKKKEKPLTGSSKKAKKSFGEFQRLMIQSTGKTSGQTDVSIATQESGPKVGSKRPARGSMEGRADDTKKTRRPPPSPSASQSSIEVQVHAGPSNALNAHPGGTSQDMEGVEGDSAIDEQGVQRPDEGTEMARNEESLPVAWEQEILDYRRRMERPLAAPPNAQRLAELTKEHRLGGAYIHAFGIGHLLSVVNMGEDPNLRGNPRDLNISHVDNLLGVFSVPGSLRDHESPIYLMVSRSLVATELLSAMAKANPHDPASEMPLLILQHCHTDEMAQLEEQLLSQVKNGKWMSEEQLKAAEEQLFALRGQAPLATLLNGQHRIHAMMRLGGLAQEDHQELLTKVRNKSISPENMRTEMADIRERAKMTGYRVEVFDSEMPDELFNYLVRNEDTRPQMGMGAGEKAWWTASRWDVLLRNAEKEGAQSRAAAADKAFSVWCKDIGVKIDRAVTGPKSSSNNKGSRGAHSKGEWAGRDAVSRLFTDPCTMELVMDTRSAMAVYENVLRRTTAVAMLQSTGAALVGRFWLACRTFLQIFNVAKGTGLQGAEQYLDAHPSITADGDADSVKPWNDLHSHPQNTPEYMVFYNADIQDEFDDLYESVLKEKDLVLNIDWKAGQTGRQVRGVFDTFGKKIQAKEPEWCRKVGACMRLYARLPLAAVDGSLQGPQFCATAALPAKRWLKRVANESQHFTLQGDGLVILEFMVDKFLPIWTVGAQSVGTSVNSHNWYGRSRGLHQILMRLVQADKFGTMEARLNLANQLLSDPNLRLALRGVDKSLGDRFRTLMRNHCVLRSHPFDFPFIDAIAPAELQGEGGRETLVSQISEARTSLKGLILRTPRPSAEQYEDLLRLPCPGVFKMIQREFWSDFEPACWVLGWNTNAAKQFRDVNAIIGWGLLMPHVDGLLQGVFDTQETLHLVETMLFLSSVTGQKGWWVDIDLFEETRSAGRNDPNTGESQVIEHSRRHKNHDDATGSNGQMDTRDEAEGNHASDQERREGNEAVPSDGSRLQNDPEGQLSDIENESEDDMAPSAPKTRAPNSPYTLRGNTESAALTAAKSLGQAQRPLKQDKRPRASLKDRQSTSSSPLVNRRGTSIRRDTPTTPRSPTQEVIVTPTEPTGGESSDITKPRGGQPSTQVNSSPASIAPGSVPLEDEPVGTDLKDGIPAWQRALQLNPPHLMTPPVAPSNTLDFLLGCGLFKRHADPEALAEAIERNAENFESVIVRINSERQKLRQSVAIAAQHCIDAEYGGYFAECGLPPMMACYKDIFVACVSRILREGLHMAEAESVNEAMAMAVSDDLYTTDIALFDHCQGNLGVDLAPTFARGHQYQLRDDETLQVGTVKGNQEDRDQVLGIMQWFHPARGIGRTEQESAERGMEGALMQLTRERAQKRSPPVYLAIVSKPEVQPTPSESQAAGELPVLDDIHKKWGINVWGAPPMQMTQQPQLSSLSTGEFTEQRRKLQSARPEMDRHKDRALEVTEQASKHWHAAQCTDSLVYKLWRDKLLQIPASRLEPGPSTSSQSMEKTITGDLEATGSSEPAPETGGST